MIEENKIIELYQKYGNELLIYIYRFTGTEETSQDILHDSFINLIKYAKNHDIENPRAFLYRVAHNLSINHIKKNKKVTINDINDNPELSSNEDFSANIEAEELNKKIYQLLDTADELTRSIFIMRKELKMELAEIAENIGKSERTVRRKIENITNHLLKNLKDTGFID